MTGCKGEKREKIGDRHSIKSIFPNSEFSNILYTNLQISTNLEIIKRANKIKKSQFIMNKTQ